MSITLLTAVPGGGKTAYTVWNVIKEAHEKGQVVYTIGIPKLLIPTIEIEYKDVSVWHQHAIVDKLPVLDNFEHGSLIVIDEVQKMWPAQGSKISEDIKALSEHRHFGLSFFIITQSPTLIHRNVLALVDRHLHIRPTWAGRKIYEWPEYCRNPASSTNLVNSVSYKYTLPKKSFSLYHSSTQHIKPVKRIPKAFYIFITFLFLTTFLIFFSASRVLDKTKYAEPEEEILISQDDSQPVLEVASTSNVIQPTETVYSSKFLTVVSNQFDWSDVASCVSNQTSCICYGHSAERLVVPDASCRLAVQHGWPGKSPPRVTTSNVVLQNSSEDLSG